MSTFGVFLGINKHSDSGVPDLTGARTDALALGTLFQDNIELADTQFLLDEQATFERATRAISDRLTAATDEDTVLITFAGHGTRDHRLVFHDTDRSRLPDTTMAMSQLADLFKKSAAKAVLLVLDCCFSGEAPARVLDDSPASRDFEDPFAELVGKGRILIAAANPAQVAWEVPGSGHGLLTKALLDALQTGDAPSVDLLAMMPLVLKLVAAEAARIGKTQTPVMLGFVEGGLHLPRMKAGKHYFAAFPGRRSTRVSSALADLGVFGIPPTVIGEWSSRFANGLNDLQLEAVNEKGLFDGRSLLVVAPTGAGKTFVGEMAAIKAITDGRKAVFLLPYKALVNEKFDDFTALYGARLGLRVVRCTGDTHDQEGAFLRGKYEIALLTYEMFLNLALGSATVLDKIGLVVLDEAQFITDPSRGIAVELLLTLVLAGRERGIEPQIVALSAVIGGINHFDAWLRAGQLITTKRPVPLMEGVIDRSGLFQYIDADGNERLERLLEPRQIVQRKDDPSAQDVIVPLVRKLVADGESVLVFRNTRGPAEGCARYLADELGLPPAPSALAALPTQNASSTTLNLRYCLQHGTAFHNSNLVREEREAIERTFRAAQELRVLAATTTLAAGINTPASTVFLAENEFIGEDGRLFTVAEYKNMAGRAGRPGFGRPGRSIIYAENAHERAQLFAKYVSAKPEPIRSSFQSGELDTWLLRLLTQVKTVAREDVARLLANTYGGYLAGLADPRWQTTIQSRINEQLDRMLSLGLLELDGAQIRLTLLGRACGQSSLPFGSCMSLVDLLRRTPAAQLSAERVLLLLQALPESGYTPLSMRVHKEKRWPQVLAQRVDNAIVRQYQRDTEEEYLRRCKRALVLLDWMSGVPTETIETNYSASPYQGKIGMGDIRRFADASRLYLRAAFQIARVMYVEALSSDDAVETLLVQLEYGLPASTHPLLGVPGSLTRMECLHLHQAGVSTAESLLAKPRSIIEQVLGRERARHILGLLQPQASPQAGNAA